MNYLVKLVNQLDRYKDEEGTSIVIPGGMNADKEGASAAFGIAVRYNPALSQHLSIPAFKGLEYLTVPRFRVEPSDDATEEIVFKEPEAIMTMVREVKEETGIKPLRSHYLDYKYRPHYQKVAGVHLQDAFLISKFDDRNLHQNIPLDGKTGIPIWIPHFLARKYVTKGQHWILDAAEQYIIYNPTAFPIADESPKKKYPTNKLELV